VVRCGGVSQTFKQERNNMNDLNRAERNNKILTAMLVGSTAGLLIWCLLMPFLMLPDLTPTIQQNVQNTRTNMVDWMTEKFWEMNMANNGYKRNEDAGGVYWTDQ
jgi:hypothetical protein